MPAVLKLNASGPDVKNLQKTLNKVAKAGLKVSGTFDAATEKALKAFQKKHKLKPDGQTGPMTMAALAMADGAAAVGGAVAASGKKVGKAVAGAGKAVGKAVKGAADAAGNAALKGQTKLTKSVKAALGNARKVHDANVKLLDMYEKKLKELQDDSSLVQFRLQEMMSRLSLAQAAQSAVMKKFNDTARQVIANLK